MAEVLESHPVAEARRAAPSATARKRTPEWTPTLAAADLECLLRVIEGELLPRLVSAYVPSRASPLPSSGRD